MSKKHYGTKLCERCQIKEIRATPKGKWCEECGRKVHCEKQIKKQERNFSLGKCRCGNPRYENFLMCEKCYKRRKISEATPKHKLYKKQKGKEERTLLKNRCLEAYGNKCACCSETRKEFLTFDHIGGWGTKHRNPLDGRRICGGLLHKWIVENGFPNTIQVLCYNCNCSLGHHGYCPHEKERQETAAQLASPVVELEKVSPDLSQCMASPNS